MSKLEPPFGGACWEGFKIPDGTVRCEEVYGHTGNHVGTEDRLIWTPEGDIVGGTLVTHQPLRDDDEHPGGETQGIDPDELGTFGEVLDFWTMRGGMTDNERTAYWMGWSRHTIALVFITTMALIVRSMYGGLVDTIATLIGAGAIVALGWQAMDAVRLVVRTRRWQR